jgi:hypothetical protein
MDLPEFKGGEFTLQVYVEGHTDNSKMEGLWAIESNWELSGARSAAVVRGLIDPEKAEDPDLARRLGQDIAAGRMEIIAAGMADRKPAWWPVCEDLNNAGKSSPFCDCMELNKGLLVDCEAALVAESDDSATVEGRLIAWANEEPPGEHGDVRKRRQRRVDLRFNVLPAESDSGGSDGSDEVSGPDALNP